MTRKRRTALVAALGLICAGCDAGGAASVASGAPPYAGGAAYRGELLFREDFEDADLSSRGWYDEPRAELSPDTPTDGGTSSFRCTFERGATGCRGGHPGRHGFAEQTAVYLSYWVKYSPGWEGSGRPYHPHEFAFVTNQDDRYVGPSRTHLTAYVEQVGGVARLALQDSSNVDASCILKNDDSFVGCGGTFRSHVFSEKRSIAACNGLLGDVDGRDCFRQPGGDWYSARFWGSHGRVFQDEPGPGYESDWHFVEAYFRLNTIEEGVGVQNGAIRYWIDGVLRITSDAILMRSAQHPEMRFDQLLLMPHIGDGSPQRQAMYVDEISVAAGVVP